MLNVCSPDDRRTEGDLSGHRSSTPASPSQGGPRVTAIPPDISAINCCDDLQRVLQDELLSPDEENPPNEIILNRDDEMNLNDVDNEVELSSPMDTEDDQEPNQMNSDENEETQNESQSDESPDPPSNQSFDDNPPEPHESIPSLEDNMSPVNEGPDIEQPAQGDRYSDILETLSENPRQKLFNSAQNFSSSS